MATTTELEDLFRRAAKIAAAVPEAMQSVAFGRALDALQSPGNSKAEVTVRNGAARQATTPNEQIDDSVTLLLNQLDRTRYPDISHDRSVADNAMRLLQAARDDFDIDGLTPAQLARLLKEKFRLSISSNAVNMALGRSGAKVDRTPEGSTYKYRLMAAGEAYLQTQR